ncbi:MAG TPA: hypothetical protein VKR23_07035 [Gaiellaceae bacterium]|nr:hypothetical protein [Gaiellaceae bacterium]
MRLLVIAGLALVLAAPAAASSWPPPGTRSVQPAQIVKRTRLGGGVRACMASNAHAKLAHLLFPVACEQPPRSQQLLITWELGG